MEFHQNQLQSAGESLTEVRSELERATLDLNALREREHTSTARRRELEQQIEKAQRSQEELRSQVLIAYQSTSTRNDPGFRLVDLKVNRPGMEAKTIRGYYP